MQQDKSKRGSLLRGTAIVSALTVVSRFFGFIRDLLVARVFGAGLYADCFFVAFRIPNLLRSFVAEGALSAAFVPVFADELRSGRAAAQRALSQVIGFLLFLTGVLCALGILLAPQIVRLIAPGFESRPQAFELCTHLTRLMFPYIVFISQVAMLNGALNSLQVFGAAAFAQVAMNLVLIGGAILAALFPAEEGILFLAYSVVAGGFVQVLVQLPALQRAGLQFRIGFTLLDPSVRQIVRLMLPAILGASIYQISLFISTLIASLLEDGSVSWLFYADRLAQFPIGIFSIALASVLLPALSGARAANDQHAFSRSIEDSLRFTSFVMIPTSVILYLYAAPLISIIFERGAFDANDTLKTAAAVQAYAFGLWGVSCHSMVSRAFIARKDTLTPTIVGAQALLLNVILSLFLVGPFVHGEQSTIGSIARDLQAVLFGYIQSPELKHAGLALAGSISGTFAFLSLSVLLAMRVKEIHWIKLFAALIRIILACLFTGMLTAVVIPDGAPDFSTALLGILLFAVVFPVFALLLGSAEARESAALLSRLARRLAKGTLT